MRLLAAIVIGLVSVRAEAAPTPRDFIQEAKALFVVGACADGAAPPGINADLVTAHCKRVRAAQDDYKKKWLTVAREFFATHVPAGIQKSVVYPFAGGDLTTALTVFPDAEEITTLSLEPAGDPRSIATIPPREQKRALAYVAKELEALYRANFSVTMNMSGMRDGELPTQLIFSLSALRLHGYEPVALRYFQVNPDGTLQYLTDADLKPVESYKSAGKRNDELANMELKFRKVGSTREQIYRHITANLDDAHLKTTPGPLRYLESKGTVSAMTKAASYLLSFDEFSAMRKYITDRVTWMVSDSTGLAPTWGTPAGFTYETYGTYRGSNMSAGKWVTPAWKATYAAQPARELKFRFGYPDAKLGGHLIIMRKAAAK